ncbi:MAG: OsmC family protein [Saccharospirillaceae bacterium]|nr:bifunctional alpha/beta hydrolase/OsmC family protein [Pseudomonadales bacterium]NRB77513.1 OsmC family protein [Saccharospirillaceae bacterium]
MPINVTFKNRQGLNLSGVLHTPQTGEIRAYALFAHCFTCTKNIKAAVNIAQAMAQHGLAVLRFDFTGLGDSDGDFSDTHFSSNIDDIEDAALFLENEYQAPSVLVGHSLGGTAVLAAAQRIKSAKAVVTIGSPADADHILHLFQNDIKTINTTGIATVKLAGRPFTIKKSFIDDTKAQKVKDNLHHLRKALLVMHSPIDEIVSVDQAAELFKNAKHPKSFISLDNADHLLSNSKHSIQAGTLLTQWVLQYLPEPIVVFTYPQGDKDKVVANINSDKGFVTTINAQGHYLLADEPLNVGGSDLGPTPYAYLSSGLAACTVMTIKMFVERKKWNLDSVKVNVIHNKIHSEECADCEKSSTKIDHFERELIIEGDLSNEQREVLLKIANRCPVHKSLSESAKVSTSYQLK